MTNYERIKNMSVEEMAQRILDGISSEPCDYCPHNDYALYAKCDCGFEYACGREDFYSGQFGLEKTYNYCPECGKLNFDRDHDEKDEYDEIEVNEV